HRHNCTTIYHAFRGSGVTQVGDERIEWSQGDILVVPPWTWHHHENRANQDSILYSITDRPALATLGLFREETA
ncbi:MAG TPA: cupin domain-containing protein, partial [Chloroflexota bacterium]